MCHKPYGCWCGSPSLAEYGWDSNLSTCYSMPSLPVRTSMTILPAGPGQSHSTATDWGQNVVTFFRDTDKYPHQLLVATHAALLVVDLPSFTL